MGDFWATVRRSEYLENGYEFDPKHPSGAGTVPVDPGRCLRLDLRLDVQVNLERCHRLDLGLRLRVRPSLPGHCGSNCASQQMRPERFTS